MFRVQKPRRMRWAGNVANMREMRTFLVGRADGGDLLGDVVIGGKAVRIRLSRKWLWGFLLNLYGSGWAPESTKIKFSRRIPLYGVRVTMNLFLKKESMFIVSRSSRYRLNACYFSRIL